MSTLQLKYLFTAEFINGDHIIQNPQDTSLLGLRNCYSDVLDAQKNGKKLKQFSLSDGKNEISVNLLTGIFIVNGLNLLLESDKLPALPKHFDLIWYHQVQKSQNVIYEKKTGNILKTTEIPEFREYFIGWKCEIAGKSYQQKLALA